MLDVPVRPWLVLRGTHAQGGHVALETELLDGRERVIGRAGTLSRGIQDIIDVSNVPAYLRLDTEEAKDPAHRVDPDERRRVPEVGHVIRRDPACVDAGTVQHRQPQAGDDRAGSSAGSCVGSGHGSSVRHWRRPFAPDQNARARMTP